MTTPERVAPGAVETEAPQTAPAARTPLATLGERTSRLITRLRTGGGPVIDADAEDATPVRSPLARTLAGFGGGLLSYLALVALPSLAAIFYLAFLASDQYLAETKFALRSMKIETREKSGSDASAAAAATGVSSMAEQDAFIVASFIRSQAIFEALPPGIDVRAIYRRPEADFWARLPHNASRETLMDYWKGMVSTYVDNLSGVVTVSVRAFRRDDALALAQALLNASEALVNDLSRRAQRDAMRMAEGEVKRAEGQMREAQTQLRAYRDSEGLISPTDAASSTSALILKAMSDRIALQSELTASERVMSAQAPTLTSLRARLAAADQQIAKLKAELVSSGGSKAISASIARFEELELQRQFSEKMYLASQDALERARQRAERQNVYLTAFVPPSLPQEAQFPRRLELSLLIPVGLSLIWGIFAMLTATVRDHQI